MKTYDFIPNDTLFCRDQRPLGAGFSFGRGSQWPLPTVLHSAIRTALLARSPIGLPDRRKPQEGNLRKGENHGNFYSKAFQWLNLIGPFPVDDKGVTYFPIPRDLVPQEGNTSDTSQNSNKRKCADFLSIQPKDARQGAVSNLPKPLTHVAVSKCEPSKDTLADWVSIGFFKDYLKGVSPLEAPERVQLWDDEFRVGVALDDSTLTAVDGNLYAAEHLRVRDGVKLRFSISEDPHKQEMAALDGLILQLGGERRFGLVAESNEEIQLPKVEVRSRKIKWVLLTPAIFVGGWLPGWIDENTGDVKLRLVDKSTRRDRRRPRREAGWKYDPANDPSPSIGAKLVAAVVGKPMVIGGWDTQPKPTMLAVPSGSVFYFEANTDDDAQKLYKALQGRCRSDYFGEKGLGLGVCGCWDHQT